MHWDLVHKTQWSSQTSDDFLNELKSQFLNWLARNALSTTDFLFWGKMWFPPPPPREIAYVCQIAYIYMTSLRTVVVMFAPTLAITSLESVCLLQGDPCSVPHGVLAPFEGYPFQTFSAVSQYLTILGFSSASLCHWGRALSFSQHPLPHSSLMSPLSLGLGAWLLSRGACFVQSPGDEGLSHIQTLVSAGGKAKLSTRVCGNKHFLKHWSLPFEMPVCWDLLWKCCWNVVCIPQ